MKIAIIGAGLAGLGAAWAFLEKGADVFLFDAAGVGGGASGVSTGLLHPFAGKKALRSWRAEEGMEATSKLIDIAQQEIGEQIEGPKGIFRPAITLQQKQDFKIRAEEDSGAVWKKIDLPETGSLEGIWIEKGRTIYTALYLKGLFLACQRKGAVFKQKKIASLSELDAFDQIIIANGAQVLEFKECQNLPLKGTIGQSLICQWQVALPFSLVSQGHITPTENASICQVGSTYEHTAVADPKKAVDLLAKVSLFYPPAEHFKIQEIRSGIRMTQKIGYHPLIQKVGEKAWVFSGLGSRGLLYHALFGKMIVEAISE